ncbi:MAG: sensor histidine kinase [Anaerolineae bacterium]|nr:sensor histidine kinase [Anaerolineae bacterium]
MKMPVMIKSCSGLSDLDTLFLQRVADGLAITADVSRADVLLYCQRDHDSAIVVAQAKPHSISPLHPEDLLGKVVKQNAEPLILRTLHDGVGGHRQRVMEAGAPVVQEVYPVYNAQGQTIAALGIETNLIERERHRRRSRVFQRALFWLQQMATRGDLQDARRLEPFGEWDGIVLTDAQRRITYLSGIATNLYRHLGYLEDLRGKRLGELQTRDDELVAEALRTELCQKWRGEEQDRYWMRQVIPLFRYDPPWPLPTIISDRLSWRTDYRRLAGAVILVHDETEARRKQQELNVQRAMVQEVHHRVKNNLQNITAVLRMQIRRCQTEEAREQLEDAVNRILSVAVIHDFLSRSGEQKINIREVFQRIVSQTEQVVLRPDSQVRIELRGPSIYLHKDQATACALVFNELLLNALEHGLNEGTIGSVIIELTDIADNVTIRIANDGQPLPDDFSLEQVNSLGLHIVQTLVHDDLRGTFSLANEEGTVVAMMSFPKMPVA